MVSRPCFLCEETTAIATCHPAPAAHQASSWISWLGCHTERARNASVTDPKEQQNAALQHQEFSFQGLYNSSTLTIPRKLIPWVCWYSLLPVQHFIGRLKLQSFFCNRDDLGIQTTGAEVYDWSLVGKLKTDPPSKAKDHRPGECWWGWEDGAWPASDVDDVYDVYVGLPIKGLEKALVPHLKRPWGLRRVLFSSFSLLDESLGPPKGVSTGV